MAMKPVDTAIKVVIGPLIDDATFKDREESITYDQAGMEIDVVVEKADGTIATTAVTPTSGGDYDWAHTDQGYYEMELPASGGASFNNTEEGVLRVVGYCTGVLPFASPAYDIVPTQVYNSQVTGTDKLQVDAKEIDSSATAAAAAQVDFDANKVDEIWDVVNQYLTYLGITSGTAQTGSSSSITLHAGASSTNDLYKGQLVRLTAGTGQRQSRHIVSYNGTTKVADISPNWATTPDNTTTFIILAAAVPEAVVAWEDAGRLDSILDTIAGDVENIDGQPMIGTNNAALASVCTEARLAILEDWANDGRLDVILDNIEADTNELQTDDVPGLIAALTIPSAATISDTVWDEAIADHTGAGSFGAKNQLVVPSETIADYKATGFAVAGDAMALTAAERNSTADIVLSRDVADNAPEPTAEEHTLRFMILAGTESDTTTNTGYLTVFQTDGTTEVTQKAITTDADANPITGVS